MDPVTVSVEVSKPRQEVFDFLDVLANHESFMDHLFTNWEYSGPRRGVGRRGRSVGAAGTGQAERAQRGGGRAGEQETATIHGNEPSQVDAAASDPATIFKYDFIVQI